MFKHVSLLTSIAVLQMWSAIPICAVALHNSDVLCPTVSGKGMQQLVGASAGSQDVVKL